MTEFLRQIARHYYTKGSMRKLCFVFPNKRALSFFKKYLSEEVAKAGRTTMAPECLTMSSLFYRLTKGHEADSIQQLLVLYDCYRKLNPEAEPLDDFIYWGSVMLSDFNDVDKYLADPEKLWKNVEEFKSMQDLSFLNEEQQKAINEFLGHFRQDGPIKQKFLQIWNILLPLYNSYNDTLLEKGISYEGQIYRTLAKELENESVVDILDRYFEPGTKFVFVGLNALNECEKTLLLKMKKAQIAEFCWDFSSAEIKDPENKSAFFMAENIKMFGQAFEIDPEGLQRPEINVLSVPSAIGQTKLLPKILEKLGPPHDIHTAIVLPDEGLLVNVLNSIPSEIKEINVTMGYPMSGSEWMGLLSLIGDLQGSLRENDSGISFYHRQVWAIFSNGVFRSAIAKEEAALTEKIKKDAKYYIPAKEFASGGLLEAIFRKAEDNAKYLKEIILKIAHTIRGRTDMSMELEFAMYSYKSLTRLQELNPPVENKTWWRLLLQLLSAEAVPFQGEPLKGMQIMGPLETRALDFESLIILSCNEGMYPRRSVAPSFIPAELRKGFGLPTYEYQDAIWAYYFYRSIQRAKKVWLLFDSRTEVSRSGEESRYIKQLELLYGFKLKRYVASSLIKGLDIPDSIEKTEEDIALLSSPDFTLSASSIRNYLDCQVKFYFHKIKGLKEPQEVDEALDAGMIGNVLHLTMQALYSTNPDEPDKKKLIALPEINRAYLEGLIKDKDKLNERVEERIKQALNNAPEVSGRNLVYKEIICSYVLQILKKDLELLKAKNLEFFTIKGLEKFRDAEIGDFRFVGLIDRIDSFEPGTIRVVDYKTGRVEEEEMEINFDKADDIINKLFKEDIDKRPAIVLQLYVYNKFMEKETKGMMLQNSIYQTHRLFVEEIRSLEVSKKFCDALEERLLDTLKDLKDISKPWRRTQRKENCAICEFKNICGR